MSCNIWTEVVAIIVEPAFRACFGGELVAPQVSVGRDGLTVTIGGHRDVRGEEKQADGGTDNFWL